MPRITKVYTRTGDSGTTALGSGARVPKTAPRIAAYGTLDELNSFIGAVLTIGVTRELQAALGRVQNELFHAGAQLCTETDATPRPGPRLAQTHVDALEHLMDHLQESLTPLQNFVLPGGAPAAAHLHVARAVCRRAERDILALAATEYVAPELLRYVNRLSDALFVMARYANHVTGVAEPVWDSRA